MLLKFTAPDMLNTSLVDVATGERAYNIVTAVSPNTDLVEEISEPTTPPGLTPLDAASTSSASFLRKSAPPPQPENPKDAERRHTVVTDAAGNIVANIFWKGRRPDIIIGDEKVGALTDLFGTSTIRFMPKILALPTRFDTEYVWTATPDSLTLFDYDTETIKGSFHQNTIRIPSKTSKFKMSSRSKLSSPSTAFLSTSSSSSSGSSLNSSRDEADQSDVKTNPEKHTFIPTRLPGVGSCYLEFQSHALAQDIEIILSFLMMEILRRGRFALTPYTFEKPRLWQLKEARDLFLRRLRRNTV